MCRAVRGPSPLTCDVRGAAPGSYAENGTRGVTRARAATSDERTARATTRGRPGTHPAARPLPRHIAPTPSSRAPENRSLSLSRQCASTRHARSGVARRADQTGRQTRNGPLSLTLCHSLRLVPDLRSSPHCAPCMAHRWPLSGSGTAHTRPRTARVTAPHTVTGRASVTVFLPQSSVTVRLL